MKSLVIAGAVALLTHGALALDVAQNNSQQTVQSPQKQEQALENKTGENKAGEKKTPEASQPEKPKPSPEMKKLAHMIGGRWQVEEKYEVTPFTPQGGEGKGMDVIHRGPGGLSLIVNYSSSGSMGETRGAGIITWSADDNAYKQFWVDDGTPAGLTWLGKWEGDSLIFSGTQSMAGKQVSWRQIYSGFSNDAFIMAFEMGQPDGSFKPFMTMRFTRMAKQAAGARRHGMGMHGRPMYDSWASPRAGLQ
jgi:hypothetical protein